MTKILIFSVPFNGHLNILKALIQELETTCEFTLVITGWKNIQPDLNGISCKTIVLAKSTLQETDPALWTFPRIVELLDDCISITSTFKPDVIIYDFFSLEGHIVGKLLNIPYWCSIPAMIGPFETQAYLHRKLSSTRNQQALKHLKKLGISIDHHEIEMVSDGLHIPGQLNLIWSYPSLTSPQFMQNRKPLPYIFVGNLRGEKSVPKRKNNTPVIYFSLGTVVMNNLWNQQRQTRTALKNFIARIAKLWQHKKITVIFVSQGKRVLNHYPKNWRVVDHTNQVGTLSRADIFVTHGGSNSFHEAALQHVPMVVIPFFGDQLLVAQQVQRLGIGINLGRDTGIGTKKSKGFLNNALVKRLDHAVFQILNDKKYAHAYHKFTFEKTSLSLK